MQRADSGGADRRAQAGGNCRRGPANSAQDDRLPSFSKHATPATVIFHRAPHYQVDVLEVRPAADGWTAILPGFGLLAEDFQEPYLRTWDLTGGTHGALGERFRVPLEPFCGVMGAHSSHWRL